MKLLIINRLLTLVFLKHSKPPISTDRSTLMLLCQMRYWGCQIHLIFRCTPTDNENLILYKSILCKHAVDNDGIGGTIRYYQSLKEYRNYYCILSPTCLCWCFLKMVAVSKIMWKQFIKVPKTV